MKQILPRIVFPLLFLCVLTFPILALVETLRLALRDVPLPIIMFVILLLVLFRLAAYMYYTNKKHLMNR
ncbi:hypothetical protein [Paenibacillus campi]|uniref:hypothetical protein n=1 Tax=Paenibacillus campi TaxID=3106031 RepID=UPI002AFF7E6E|nr:MULTISPECIES: hypothetical protein [unclassified Paenibacillus]